jgi:hypothetical protein
MIRDSMVPPGKSRSDTLSRRRQINSGCIATSGVVQQALQLIQRLSIIVFSHALRLPMPGVFALVQKLRHEVPAREKTRG